MKQTVGQLERSDLRCSRSLLHVIFRFLWETDQQAGLVEVHALVEDHRGVEGIRLLAYTYWHRCGHRRHRWRVKCE